MIHYTHPSQQPGWGKAWTRRPGTLPVGAGQKACVRRSCGQPFTPTGRQAYCSETCRYTAYMQRRAKRRASKGQGSAYLTADADW